VERPKDGRDDGYRCGSTGTPYAGNAVAASQTHAGKYSESLKLVTLPGLLSPQLAAKLCDALAAKQLAASIAACELAIAMSGIAHPLVSESLAELRAGRSLSALMIAELVASAEHLDRQYQDHTEARDDNGPDSDGYWRTFAESNAIAAVAIAGSQKSAVDAAQAIFKAWCACGKSGVEVIAAVEAALM
jgi:hypothetical protein